MAKTTIGIMGAKIQNTYRNRIIFAVLGFGLAGAIWGCASFSQE